MIEAHDEWQASDRRYQSEVSMAMLNSAPTVLEPQNTARGGVTTQPELATSTLQHANELHHPMGRDPLVMDAARAFEQVRPWAQRSPDLVL